MRNVRVTEVPADVQLIDVRENDEWAAGHARGAVHIPMSEFTSRLDEVDTTREVYVICKAGGRSMQVGQYLEQAQGANVINVEGGTDAWVAAGLPTD
ncbi:rhodanese-like domain-containing protein [Corynebacterium halotolerans]|uniref:rhodanese-like domain-containing protein n=1 Tax=Corynebacterium halotolerans TaxID=225326 RepID=UPI003CFBB1CB